MSAPQIVVLDSSVGVKWFKPEPGREQAGGLLKRHQEGSSRIIVSSIFEYELLGVAVKHGGPQLGDKVWGAVRKAELTVVGLDETVVREAFRQCSALGCTFYDALAPALASLLGAELYSADSRAHSDFPEVTILGSR